MFKNLYGVLSHGSAGDVFFCSLKMQKFTLNCNTYIPVKLTNSLVFSVYHELPVLIHLWSPVTLYSMPSTSTVKQLNEKNKTVTIFKNIFAGID